MTARVRGAARVRSRVATSSAAEGEHASGRETGRRNGRRGSGSRDEIVGMHGTRAAARRTLVGTIRKIPAYVRLLAGLLTDRRVSAVDKAIVVGAIAYVISPIDIIPDVIPFLGQVDDLYLLMFALRRLIARAGLDVLADHWTGDIEDLSPSSLRSVSLAASLFLPRRIRRRLRRLARRG